MNKIILLVVIHCLGVCDAYAGLTTVPGCVSGEGDNWWQDEQAIMGTEVRVELMHESQEVACAAIGAVMAEMRRIDQAMSPYIETSLLSKLNREAHNKPVVVGPELYDLISKSLIVSRITHGAFDVTYASAGRFYNYRDSQLPVAAVLAKAVAAIDYRYLEMNPGEHAIGYKHAGVYVDLGGIAKGYAVDRGIGILRDRGISHAMVAAGGDSRMIGERTGEPWIVGIRDPRNADQMVAVLPLIDVSVSTSGDYERFFEKDGVRYHHILDPKTGDSAREIQSVTILGDSALRTDALSTSVFVLGVRKGLTLINNLNDIDAIIIDSKGVMHVSDSLLEMSAGVHP